ncbi:hypothetical protein RJ640_016616 [Escallonia rubra]|uniref:NECAP PHear domain-containing protein n=1 Tax=Escallonia rubra TaxID=112253 RepID=A0AA88UB03_9ASTE|nr:hypothetical protein RJ640_016616 [Escallonia rubra]
MVILVPFILYRADEWDINKWAWEGILKVTSKGEECIIKLEDKTTALLMEKLNTGELYARAFLRDGEPHPVEPVIDSSRYFVLRVEENIENTSSLFRSVVDNELHWWRTGKGVVRCTLNTEQKLLDRMKMKSYNWETYLYLLIALQLTMDIAEEEFLWKVSQLRYKACNQRIELLDHASRWLWQWPRDLLSEFVQSGFVWSMVAVLGDVSSRGEWLMDGLHQTGKDLQEGGRLRHAFIGIGFRERPEAYDFQAALHDHMKYLNKKKAAEEMEQHYQKTSSADYSLKDGETLVLQIKNNGGRSSRSKFFEQGLNNVSLEEKGNGKEPVISIKPPPPPLSPLSPSPTSVKFPSESPSNLNLEEPSIEKSSGSAEGQSKESEPPLQNQSQQEIPDDDFGDFQTAV